MQIEFVDLRAIDLDRGSVQEQSEVQARRLRAVVLKADGRDVLVGMLDPTDIVAYDEFSRALGRPLRICRVSEADLPGRAVPTFSSLPTVISLRSTNSGAGSECGDPVIDHGARISVPR